jgi:hypothetical protein
VSLERFLVDLRSIRNTGVILNLFLDGRYTMWFDKEVMKYIVVVGGIVLVVDRIFDYIEKCFNAPQVPVVTYHPWGQEIRNGRTVVNIIGAPTP